MKVSLAVLGLVLATASTIRFATLPPAPALPERVEAWPVVRGSIGGEPVIWHVAFSQGEGARLCPLQQSDLPGCRLLEGLPLAELRAMKPNTWAQHSTFFLTEPITEGTVPPDANAHSLALATMLAGSRARLPRENVEGAVTAELERPHDAGLVAWAQAHRSDDALYEAFTRHLAMGECSADTGPQDTARLFAELALARGDRPTFIDLQIQLIRNSFERVAHSSLAEQGSATSATRLVEAGVDVDELFLGLLIQRPGSAAAVDDWRLARAIREAGRTDALLPRVEALATSGSLDPYNRFRATEVWLHLQVYDGATSGQLAAVKARAAKLELHPLARLRIDEAN